VVAYKEFYPSTKILITPPPLPPDEHLSFTDFRNSIISSKMPYFIVIISLNLHHLLIDNGLNGGRDEAECWTELKN